MGENSYIGYTPPPPPKPKPVAKKKKKASAPRRVYTFGGKVFASPGEMEAFKAKQRRLTAEAENRKRQQRQAAYNALRRRQAQLYAEFGVKTKGAYQEQQGRLRELADRKIDKAATDKINQRKYGAGEVAITGAVRRQRALDEAKRSGNYLAALEAIRKGQRETGGRYLDRELYTKLYEDYQRHVKDVSDRFNAMAAAADALRRKAMAGDRKAKREFLKTVTGKAWKASVAEFTALVGDGRKPGSLAAISRAFDEIAAANDDYFKRSVFGLGASSDEVQLAAQREAVRRALTRQKVRWVEDAKGNLVRRVETHEISLNQYLDELADAQRERLEQAQGMFQRKERQLKIEGYRTVASADGRAQIYDVRDQAAINFARKALGPEADRLFGDLQNGSSVDRARALEAIIDAAVKAKASDLSRTLVGAIDQKKHGPGTTGDIGDQRAFQSSLESYRDHLTTLLAGRHASQGIERLLQTGMKVPLLGELMKGLGLAASAVPAFIRFGSTSEDGRGGRAVTPNLDLGRPPTPAEKQEFIDRAKRAGFSNERIAAALRDFRVWGISMNANDPAQEIMGEIAAKRDFGHSIQSANGDLGKMFEAIMQYGAEPFQGNIGNFAAQVLLDPTIAVNVSKFLGSGRLAIEASGGVKASLLGAKGTAVDWAKLLAPKSVGGYGAARYTLRTTLRDLSKLVKRDLRSIADIDQADIDAALRRLIEHPQTVTEATNFLTKALHTTPANAQQILASVQQYAAGKAGTHGLQLVDAVTLERQLREAEAAFRTAGRLASQTRRAVRKVDAARTEAALVERVREGRIADAAAHRTGTVGNALRAKLANRRHPHFAKDLQKADRANKFIGAGGKGSSTDAYAKALGGSARKFTDEDVVFVSANGRRAGRVAVVDANGALTREYAALDDALAARATILTDEAADRARPYNIGEREVETYLRAHGYVETKPGVWRPAPRRLPVKDPVREQILAQARQNVTGLSDSMVAAAARARSAARKLTGTQDTEARRAAYAELRESLSEFDAAAKPNPANAGSVWSAYDQALLDFENAASAAGTAKTIGVARGTEVELARDLRFVDAQIAALRPRLAAATGADKVKLATQLRNLGAARRAILEAKIRARAQGDTAREVVRRGRTKAAGFIRRPILATKARTKEGVLEEQGRSYSRSFAAATVANDEALKAGKALPPSLGASPVNRKRVGEAKQRLQSVPPDLRSPEFDRGIREALEGLDLWEALVALDSVVAAGSDYYAFALAELVDQTGRLAKSSNEVRDVLDLYRRIHDDGSSFLDLKVYQRADRSIVREFRRVGIAERRGQVRFLKQSKRPPESVANADRALLQTAAKVRALRGHGVSIHAYDEGRTVLRDAELRKNASLRLTAQANKAAAAGGETFDEAYERLYEVKLQKEAADALEAFAMQPRFDGWTPDEILSVFEEEQLARDLGRERIRSKYQMNSMRMAISDLTSIPPGRVDDLEYVSRALGGFASAPTGMRLATDPALTGIKAPVPVFVAPASHPDWQRPHLTTAVGYHLEGFGIVLREGHEWDILTAAHEYGHAVVKSSPTDPTVVGAMNMVRWLQRSVDFSIFQYAAVKTDAHEAVAELYGLWAAGRRVKNVLVDLDAEFSWDDFMARLNPQQQVDAARLAGYFAQFPVPSREAYHLRGYNVPPLSSRQETYQWLVDNGFWAPRTAQRIREGGEVWSIAQERAFFQSSFGFTPPWADPDILWPALNDPAAFQELMTQFGYLDNGIELHASALNLDADGRANAIAFGSHEAEGIKRGRTVKELRDWFSARFGDLVVDDNGEFISVPWLMDAGGAEYKAWVDKMLDAGAVIDPKLVKPHQMAKFREAYKAAVDRRLKRLLKTKGYQPGDDWLPQEQMRFAIDVTNELLMSREWRSVFERAPIAARGLRLVGELQRLLVVGQLAFPVMNLIDRFTVKQVVLMIANSGYRFWRSVDEDAARTVSSLRSINIRERGIWDLRTSSHWERVRDSDLATKTRALSLLGSVKDLGYEISSWGEDSLKLNFAQRMYQSIRNDLVAEGMDLAQARVLALAQTRKRVLHFFPSMEDASDLERALNQLVPFLSYNFRNQLLGLEIAVSHPWLWNVANQIGNLLESENRANWEEEHPGVPMPEHLARRLIFRADGEAYAIDFSQFSDWFRGPERFNSPFKAPDTVGDWITTFFRVPHPVQLALGAWLTGGKTPWGTDATVDSFLPIAGFLPQLFGDGEASGLDPVQFVSKMLFFKEFAKVDITEARASLYFDLLRAGRRDLANDLLDQYPDVEAWLDARRDPDRFRPRLDGFIPSWFRGRSAEEVARFEAAKAGLASIREAFDRRLDALYDQPWSDEYGALKKERRAAILAYMLAHPELIDARAISMSWSDWLDEQGAWAVDDLVDDFFAQDDLRRPDKAKFTTDLEYQKAREQYLLWRLAYLKAHPQVAEVLGHGRTVLEQAWKDQQAHWDEILLRQTNLKIDIIEESAKGAAKDYELIDALYELSDANYLALDAEAFAGVYEVLDRAIAARTAPQGSILGMVKTLKLLPGRADLFFEKADEAERAEILANEAKAAKDDWYANAIGAIARKAKSGADFYRLLEKNPKLMAEYFRRKPDKAARYRAGKWYYNEITAVYNRAKSGRDFYRLLALNPRLQAEYFARNADSKAKYEAGQAYFKAMQRWVKLLDAGQYETARRYFDGLPAWVRERYFAKHPDKRGKAAQSAAYVGAMGEWVRLLKKKDYDAAQRFFDGLPSWMRERYFAKHPEARARFEADSPILKAAQAYFTADDAHKLQILRSNPAFAKWFREQGGDEEKRRGMILAAYRSFGKQDAWLRRVIRDRYPEIFSQEGQGERRLRNVARKLALNPQLVELYEQWVTYQYHVYREQLKLSGVPPKPLDSVHLGRLHERKRKRRSRRSQYSSVMHGGAA